ncbi:type 1 fimbrial minor subunit FimI [Erwinia tasmaniensis]|uniref:FimI fimbrial protein, FimI n=1 Tax=Erwinia tasmaniensis (strain DSM 17950 / CFBP 7177 / CIP 109463 / NCPPB 4357 / Et1/99) TaxID=465817 RepID=B2VEW7_ERWT9|nr:fimbrial protein [Erwinia tasmaniensis]CAO97914.1 FimI fimbrial protein, FimI [Erwinia tasmaniensis Et1/99]
MLKIRLGLFLMLLAPLSMAGNKWNVTLPGGQMRFQGELIAEACTVDIGDRQLIVHMGQVSSNRFKAVGDDADPVPFTLHLQDCNTNVSERVGIVFHGVADGKNPDVLSVGEGEGTATGVGIALFDDTGKMIPVNSVPQAWKPLVNGARELQFVARYRATGHAVNGGKADAQAWFSLTYQ